MKDLELCGRLAYDSDYLIMVISNEGLADTLLAILHKSKSIN